MDIDEESRKRTKEARERWEKSTLEESLRGLGEGRETYESLSGIPLDRIYTPLDLEKDKSLTDIGFPGEFPFTRGVYPTMYRSRLWTMRQYAGFGTAEDTNKRYKYLLEQGQTGLSVAFDLPTQMGYDSDHPMASGEVGKVGVAISSLRDMEVLFDGIPLDKVSTSMTINSTAMILLAMYVAVGEKQGVDRSNLRGTIQNDILKEYVARGTYIFAPEPSMRLVTDTIEFCSKEMKRWNSISISGYHIREAGSTAIQEIAFTLANAIAYVDAVVSRELDVDAFAPRLTFFFCAHNDLLEEVAKFRAARRLWARIMKDRFGAKLDRSMMLRFHTQTSGVSLTAQQPENNAIRVAIQALAAVLGGTQSLHTNSMDEALALPSEHAATLALRTQQIIAHESGVTNTIDPLAGSYFLESLTDEIEKKTVEYIEKIDEMGGVAVAIEKGYLQHEIADSAYRYQRDIENKGRIVVGVNEFKTGEPSTMDTLKVNPEVESKQKQGLAELREERDNGKVARSLKDLKEEAGKDTNLVPYVLDCVSNLATLGEISDVLREVFGRYEGGRTV
ncbi:MAG: methylmalonyl-CoA mutase family protein [Thermoplasmata archaeon]|nr:methylmalonyl-CoA mutase family protein [Thermoplasmata archaeon]